MAIKVSGTVVIDDSRVLSNLGAALTVSNGGHGQTTLTANSLVVGNGTGAVTLLAPGSSSNIVVSNGTNFVSSNTANIRIGSIGVGTPASGTLGEIRAIDNVTAYYGSDSRLKENLRIIEEPISLLSNINGYRFDWTEDYINHRGGEDGYFIRKEDVGVIAQEIQKILPEAVAERKDGYLAVNYEKIIPLLIEAIKELKLEMDKIKEK